MLHLPALAPLFAQAPSAPSGPAWWEQLLPIALLVVIFVVFIYLPQRRQQKEHEELVSSLKKDDKVVTSNGMHGRIAEVGAETVVIDFGGKTRITVDKGAVTRREGDDKAAEAAK